MTQKALAQTPECRIFSSERFSVASIGDRAAATLYEHGQSADPALACGTKRSNQGEIQWL
jgi:uroporphyrinogen-III synthase